MRRLLKEISVIPGVAGSCIFDKSSGALCSELRDELPKDLPENIGIHFVRLVQMGTMNKLTIRSAHFRFDRYSVVGLPLDTGAILLAICESDANSSLVATTAAMLADDMPDELEITPLDLEESAGAEKKGNAQMTAETESPPAALKPQLGEIESALASAIGPVAGMVMTDYLNRWVQDGPADRSRLGELITMLSVEIGDDGLAGEFQAKIRHLLQ